MLQEESDFAAAVDAVLGECVNNTVPLADSLGDTVEEAGEAITKFMQPFLERRRSLHLLVEKERASLNEGKEGSRGKLLLQKVKEAWKITNLAAGKEGAGRLLLWAELLVLCGATIESGEDPNPIARCIAELMDRVVQDTAAFYEVMKKLKAEEKLALNSPRGARQTRSPQRQRSWVNLITQHTNTTTQLTHEMHHVDTKCRR